MTRCLELEISTATLSNFRYHKSFTSTDRSHPAEARSFFPSALALAIAIESRSLSVKLLRVHDHRTVLHVRVDRAEDVAVHPERSCFVCDECDCMLLSRR